MGQERATYNSNNNVDEVENKGVPLIRSCINQIRDNCKKIISNWFPIVFLWRWRLKGYQCLMIIFMVELWILNHPE